MKIKTTLHQGGVWTAIDDDAYDDPSSPTGSGTTREEAIIDLMEKLGMIEE